MTEKSNFETPEGVPTKARPSKISIIIMVNYIPRFNFVFRLSCNVFKDF